MSDVANGSIPLFLNLASGSAPADPEAFAAGIDARLQPRPLPGAEISAAVAEAARNGVPLVAVAGGDGTIRGAAEALIGTGTALLPMPFGTFNHFARRLGLEDAAACTAALEAGAITSVPVGEFTARAARHSDEPGPTLYFLNTLTFGEYAAVLRQRAKLRPYLTKWPAAVVAFLSGLTRAENIEVGLEVAGAAVSRRTPLLWLGMGWGSFPRVHEAIERRAEPDLELAVLRPSGVLQSFGLLFRLSSQLMRRQIPIDDPGVEILHTRQLTLHGRQRIDTTADGEILRLNPPIEIAVRDAALRVLVPPPPEEPEPAA